MGLWEWLVFGHEMSVGLHVHYVYLYMDLSLIPTLVAMVMVYIFAAGVCGVQVGNFLSTAEVRQTWHGALCMYILALVVPCRVIVDATAIGS